MSFSPEEKLEIVFQGMKDDITIKELCEKHDISRKTYYDWLKDIKDSAKESWDNQKVGRKGKDDIDSVSEAQQKIEELKEKKQSLEEKLEGAQKEAALSKLEKDYIKFKLTENDIDPEVKKKNKEILKKSDFPEEKKNGS